MTLFCTGFDEVPVLSKVVLYAYVRSVRTVIFTVDLFSCAVFAVHESHYVILCSVTMFLILLVIW